MKKVLAFALALMMLVCLSVPAQAASATSTITIKFTAAKLVSNNHVGNSWSKTVSACGKNLSVGGSVKKSMKSTDTLTVMCTATEKDKNPDIGTATISVKVSALKKGTTTYTKSITVVENSGRYKGNAAVWKFTVTVTKK